MIDLKDIKKDFPIYQHEPNLIYLDSAASALKPQVVIDRVNQYYETSGVNVHRGTYQLAYEATEAYEKAREKVASFISAEPEEIIFTRGTTSALNMVAQFYRNKLKPDDEIITSELEHHSSLLPWMANAKATQAKLVYIPLTKEGRITVENFKSVLTPKTKVVAINYISNVMGYKSPVEDIIKIAHEKGITVILDAAQAVPHMKVDVKSLDVDFLAFSGHKMLGPSGIGVLYGKKQLLNDLEPVEYGGEMVDEVFKDHAEFSDAPIKFEAGTPIISGAIGLAKAVEYMEHIGYDTIHQHTMKLHDYTMNELKKINHLVIYNEGADISTLTFNIEGVHPHDVSSYLDQDNICIRAGHHCAQLVSRFLEVPSTLRVSFHIYNTIDDCKKLVESLRKASDFFQTF